MSTSNTPISGPVSGKSKNATQSARDELIIAITSIGSLVLLNMLSLDHFTRIDLTRENIFTLSDASETTMKDLEDPVTVTAYFSSGLPTHFEQNKRYVKDLLEEYRAASKGMLSFEFIDPESLESDEDKETKKEIKRDIFGRAVREPTKVEAELTNLGVQPVEMRVVEDDQATTKRGYMGIVVRYQEETEVIPVVQDTSGLEYDLTISIRKLVRTKTPVLGLLQGKGEPSLEEDLDRVKTFLSQMYEVRAITLTDDDPKIEDDIDALLIVGTKSPYNAAQKRVIDQYLMKGKSAAFLLDLVNVDLRAFAPTPVEHGFGDLLSAYGIELGAQVVADVECASLNVSEKRGFMIVQMPVKFPFIPQLAILDADSPITNGIADVPLPFVAPLFLKNDIAGVTVKSLARSSEKSWLEDPTPQNMDPRRDYRDADVTFTGPYDLIATASGQLPSAYAGVDGAALPEGVLAKSEKEARVIVAGTSGIANEAFLGPQTATLLLNIVDWMLLDPALLAMRTRGLAEAPLEPELADSVRAAVKWGNVLGVPALLVVFGLVLWRNRSARRRAVAA